MCHPNFYDTYVHFASEIFFAKLTIFIFYANVSIVINNSVVTFL
jgi:hypothetical protein